jgi:dihydrofolate reductase
MIIISAMTEDRVIGSGDGMPWNVPTEYEQYLEFVRGNSVVLGRKSYEIFGPDLPAKTTAIVVSRGGSRTGAVVVSSLEKALAAAEKLNKPVFVAGGSSIYQQALPWADEMYLSTIRGHYTGDAYFPDFDLSEWIVTVEREAPEFIFRKYLRR